MLQSDVTDINEGLPPFDQFKGIRRLSTDRSGHDADAPARHQLFVGRDRKTSANVLIKLTSKPGLVYEANLMNEIESLSTINHELPASPYFPVVLHHGRVRDGRVYLIASLFDEFPLATTIGDERVPARMVTHLRATLAIATALIELHRLNIFHVDLNPMNILYRADKGRPIIRIVDFESSYEVARHSDGVFYNPPTTPGYSAPELTVQPPDARADLFSLGAVLYTLLAGYRWTWEGGIHACVEADAELDPALRAILRKAVHKDPDRRYAAVQEFRTVLAAYLEDIWPGRSW